MGFLSFSALYFAIIAFFDHIREFLRLPPSGPELCTNTAPGGEDCWRADLFAFEIVSGVALTWCGVLGFWAWHVQKVDQMIPSTPEGRLFGYLPLAHQLTALGTTFQLFDLFVSLLIPEQRQVLFLCHHIMAALVSWFGLNNQVSKLSGGAMITGTFAVLRERSYQYFHYYGIFFLGCSEISTIPLLFIDLAGFFPPQPGTVYDFLVNGICGPLFAVTFTTYRVVLWWIVGIQMFRDIFAVMNNGMAKKLRPGRNHVLYVMMVLNLLLTGLQLYWFQIILAEAAKVLGFDTSFATLKQEL